MATFTFGKSELEARRKATLISIGYMAVGLGIGTVAGLLAAPKSGRQLRKDVGRKLENARDAVETLSKQAGEMFERGEELAEAAMKKTEPVARFLRRGA